MTIWRVSGPKLVPIDPAQLGQEERLEEWIANDPSILGTDLAVIGRQVMTGYGGKIDLLALDADANCVVLELKKGRTPREVVAQLLDYATWVKDLGYNDLDQIAQRWRQKSVASIFIETFGEAIPESVNATHNLVVVASELDESSERIISYLSEEHGVSINAVFFTFFREGGGELLGRAWLRDPIQTMERAEGRKRTPWSGEWFVNVGDDEFRAWEDNREYGYVAAGQGEKYSRPLRHLQLGDKIFAYVRGAGYVGYGEVTKQAVPVKDFVVDSCGSPLLELPLHAPRAGENKDSAELSDWAVGVRWLSQVPREQAKTFKWIFANSNIVCKLRDPKTLEFLRSEFGAEPSA